MKIHRPKQCEGFSWLEGLVVVFGLALVAVVILLNVASSPHSPPYMIICLNNLKQDGLAFNMWADDNGGKYPMEVLIGSSGARELTVTGNVAACFGVLYPYLHTTKTFICPADTDHEIATNSTDGFSRANISYFIGLSVTEGQTNTLLSGDANLVAGGRSIPSGGNLNLWSNTVTWTTNRHHGFANILWPDGAAQRAKQIGGLSAAGVFFATNRIVIP